MVLPPRKAAGTLVPAFLKADFGIVISAAALLTGLSETLLKSPLTLLKKAARAQCSRCAQERYGSSWHSAHCSCTPMNSEATARADPPAVILPPSPTRPKKMTC